MGHRTAGGGASTRPDPNCEAPQVLFVCTANQIRSPLAAAIMERLADERKARVEVTSAGFGPAGMPAVDRARRIARDMGLDLSEHLSRTVDPNAVRAADVVICMEADHLLRLVELSPGPDQPGLPGTGTREAG